MTKKTKFSPKIKHKAFTSFMVKLQDDDWMLGIFNPNDKTAAYFLAEPAVTNSSAKMTGSSKNKGSIISGYMISALSRQGMLETTIAGLPRKFKTVEDATEWLEGQVERYDGDTVKIDEVDLAVAHHVQNMYESEQKAKKVDYSDCTFYEDVKAVEMLSKKKKTKAVNKPKAPTSPKNKFKTSKEELEALGLGGLLDD